MWIFCIHLGLVPKFPICELTQLSKLTTKWQGDKIGCCRCSLRTKLPIIGCHQLLAPYFMILYREHGSLLHVASDVDEWLVSLLEWYAMINFTLFVHVACICVHGFYCLYSYSDMRSPSMTDFLNIPIPYNYRDTHLYLGFNIHM